MSAISSYCSSILSHTPNMIKTPNQSTTTTTTELDNSKKEKEFLQEVTKALQNLLDENAHTSHFCDTLIKDCDFFNLCNELSNDSSEEVIKFECYRKPKID
jgi:hypothetical protein